MITAKAVKCVKCHDVIYSVHRHDFHHCGCGNTFIDGGFDYLRYGWTEGKPEPVADCEVDATREELVADWNKHPNDIGRKYGRIAQ